jgi:hypothetical protein
MSGHVRFMTPRSLDWFAHVAAISALVLEACSRHHGDSQLEQAARAVEQTNTRPDALFDSVRLAVQPDLMSNERLSATRAISSARPHPAPRCATEEGRAAATQEESRRGCERDEAAEPNITTWFCLYDCSTPFRNSKHASVSVWMLYGCLGGRMDQAQRRSHPMINSHGPNLIAQGDCRNSITHHTKTGSPSQDAGPNAW